VLLRADVPEVKIVTLREANGKNIGPYAIVYYFVEEIHQVYIH
jgi:hypothetical protein